MTATIDKLTLPAAQTDLDRITAQQRTQAGKALVDDFIAGRNERADSKTNPLTTGQRWHNAPR